MQESERDVARRAFLDNAGWAGVTVLPLPPDASFRRYFRVHGSGRAAMLMDAPPPQESVQPFVKVAHHLASLGLYPPHVYAQDVRSGFVLLEDFGDDTFTRLLASGADEHTLYCLAVDVLSALHRHPSATDIAVPRYDTLLVNEALLLVDWYYPAVCGQTASDKIRGTYVDIWGDILASLPALSSTLVLRDYHVDNLMRVVAADGSVQCGLLDFQDAVIGSPAYDLMSLLEDARRDVPSALVEEMSQRYHRAVHTRDVHTFAAHFRVLAAQRHCKVAGIFVRLCRRDGKRAYLTHIPRVLSLLQRHLDVPMLRPLQAWLDTYLPMRHEVEIALH